MKKLLHAGLTSKALQALAFLLWVIFFVACSTSPASIGPISSTAENARTQSTQVNEQVARDTGQSAIGVQETNGGFSCHDQQEIPTKECQALVALYTSTDGQRWIDNTGWMTARTPCSWSGVGCTGGHVSYLGLYSNRLRGNLPPELGDLSHLRGLELWGNQLRGSIPGEFRALSELDLLEMSSNQLTGSLPVELGKLRNLKTLNLAFNQLTGSIPPELGKMRNLQLLVLSHNQLSGAIPETLGSMSSLYDLDLSYNQLSGPVPGSVAQISNRSLWGNQLAGTVTTDGGAPCSVDFKGFHFASHPSLAESIWPEVVPAISPSGGDPFWYASPQHLRFTFANSLSSQERLPMGINLEAEAQILIYPLQELVSLSPQVKAQVESLRNLLGGFRSLPAGDLPLLPLNNALQVIRAQVEYLDSDSLQGLRYITQFTQEVRPVINNRELIYTFQGITTDGLHYVAAYFPLTAPVLPDKFVMKDWETLDYDFETYLAETTALLDQLSPAEFFPQVSILDGVVTSIVPDSNGG